MNNLDKIIEKINAESKAEAEKILLAATENAAEITEEGTNKASDSIAKAKRKADKDALSLIERAYSSADMKKREILLGTKVGLIGKAFAEAEEKLLSLGDKEYCAFAAHLLADAVYDRMSTVEKLKNEYGDEEEYSLDFEVIFNEEDKKSKGAAIVKAAKALLKKISPEAAEAQIKVSDKTAAIKGGLVVRYGDIETNCSVESVVAAAKTELEPKVAQILFAPNAEIAE